MMRHQLAFSQMTSVDLHALAEGPTCPGSHGLDRAQVERVLQTLHAVAQSTVPPSPFDVQAAKHALKDENLPERARRLTQLLEKCLENNSLPATVYG